MPDVPRRAPLGSVVIPAYNEEAVLGRLLTELAEPARTGEFEIVVVPNGCVDATAEVARGFAGVRVEELAEGSKATALNRGDELATAFPRLFLDADLHIDATTIRALFAALDGPDAPLAGRPRTRYVTTGADPLVRAYYRARERAIGLTPNLWGGGLYAISERGRARFDRFPATQGDDYWIDSLFTEEEKVYTPGTVDFFPPRTARDLITVYRRVYRGNASVDADATLSEGAGHCSTTESSTRRLLTTVRGPRDVLDSAAYVALTLAARLSARRTNTAGSAWERDESSRALR